MEGLVLANGEKELKTYSCFSGNNGKGELSLTSSRLIFRFAQQYDTQNKATQQYEVSIKDIKSIRTSYVANEPKRKVGLIIFGVLSLIAGIVCLLLKSMLTSILGAVLGCLGIVLIIVGAKRKPSTYAGSIIIELNGQSSGNLIIAPYAGDVKNHNSSTGFCINVTCGFENLQNEIGAIWQNAINGRS